MFMIGQRQRNRLRLMVRGVSNITVGRRFETRIFCVGAAKTGTHTIGEMFADRVPAAHEQDAEQLISLILARAASPGPSSTDTLRRYLVRRDRWRGLQIDSSQVNIYLIDDIEALFPDSRYILTLRPPASWLRSMIDDSLRREISSTWGRFRDFRFGLPASENGPDAALAKAGLYSLDGYLGYWRSAAQAVLEKIPPQRRLVVNTGDIQARTAEIARFCTVPDPDRAPQNSHSFRNDSRFGILGAMDPDYIVDRLETLTGDIARQVFTDWSPSDDLARALAS